tara:strand:- start:9730 stop:11280 length:1551 start_codon:yes stop_codon:yes gene_type:complete
MAFITGIPIRNSIHTEESTSVADWGKYRSELTGLYITGEGTGAMYEQYAAQDFREYNKKIHDLGLNEFNSDLYLRPFDAGFRYTHDPLLGKYSEAAGAYSTKDIGFGGYLMSIRTNADALNREAYVLGDTTGNISLEAMVAPTGTGFPAYTYDLGNTLGTGSQQGPYEVKSFQSNISGREYKITYVKDAWFEDLSGYMDTYEAFPAWELGDSPDASSFALNVSNAPNGDVLVYPWGVQFFGFFSVWIVSTQRSEDGGENDISESFYVYEKEWRSVGAALQYGPQNYVVSAEPVYSTLGAFVGQANGYVTDWYDQSHTGSERNNLIQETAADQPTVVNGGSLVTDSSGNTALDFDGSNQHMTLNTGFSSTLNISALSSYTVFQADTIAGTQMVSTLGSFADSNKRWYAPFISSNNFSFNYGAGSAPSTSANTNLNLVSMVADSTQGAYKAFLNSSQVGSDGSLEDKSGGTSLVGVGGLGDSLHFNGKMGEFLIYSGQSASVNREAIQDSINERFSIY